MRTLQFRHLTSLFLLAAVMGTSHLCAEVLSDNISRATADVELLGGTTWLASSFGTGTSAYSLSSATLLLANPADVGISLSLYSDSRSAPGSLVGSLTAPTAFGTGLAAATFGGNNLALSANTTYWLVLQTTTAGGLGWAWTEDNFGTGIGFQHTFSATDDSGRSWYTTDIQPLMMAVTADSRSVPGQVPEPNAGILMLAGSTFLFAPVFVRRMRRQGEA